MAQKLFVGGLSFSTSNDRLRELFAEAGNVESAVVVTDRDTGRSRGFGFVEMSTPEEAEQAVQRYNGKEVDGRQLKVELAKSLDRNAEIVVHCKSGQRSAQACELLRNAGFARVSNLAGGINAWAKTVDPKLPTY